MQQFQIISWLSPSLPLPFVFIPILNKQLRTLELRKLAQNRVGRNRIINLTVSLCHQSRFQTMNLIKELNLSHLKPMLLFKSLALPSVLWVYPNVVPQRGCMMVLLPFMQVMWTSVLSKAFFFNFWKLCIQHWVYLPCPSSKDDYNTCF